MDIRRLFLKHVAQTSASPLGIEVKKAKGALLWDADDKEYIDLIAGISVANIGHRHPAVIRAIKKQLDQYLHVLVYGELIESPQVEYAKMLSDHLPPSLNSVYFTNSGAEAVEGAMKLAKKATGRTQIVAFNKSYHGSTQGALSIMGDEYWRNAFRPLLPGILHANYNSRDSLALITQKTACVVMETIQAEIGVNPPGEDWIKAVRKRCTDTGTLLVLDEIQTGFGRCGTLWGFEQYGVVPDILLLGKALGGGLPLGAFIAEKQLMRHLANDPVLGHITTFGGHPLSCTAGLAAFKVLLKKNIIAKVDAKEKLFKSLLHHEEILALRSKGLLMALEFDSAEKVQLVVSDCLKHGVFTDWFLFSPHCLRIAPPLTISAGEIRIASQTILNAINSLNLKPAEK